MRTRTAEAWPSPFRRIEYRWVCFVALVVAGCTSVGETSEAVPPFAVIRVNAVGYLPLDPKVAILSSDRALDGEFEVGGRRGPIGPDAGPFGPFAHNYRLDFTALRDEGRYSVCWGAVRSPEFAVSRTAFRAVPPLLLGFVRLQRCGWNPVTHATCHDGDAVDAETGRVVDLRGGWHDAGDRIKHCITTSYCVAGLALAGALDEAQHGAEFVAKIHPDAETLYVQVGDDRDHGGGWTAWHDDRTDYGSGPGGRRAAWPATGHPAGPRFRNASTGLASLAGRCAAALALAGGDLAQARSLYALAKAHPGYAQSVPVKAPYAYVEATWYDDLEWAATELYRATKDEAYLAEAIHWADLASGTSWMGLDRHGHYEFFPYVNLAHWRLYDCVPPDVQRRLAGYYRAGLDLVRSRAEANAYRFGTPLSWCSTNDVAAFATQAILYERMTGDPAYHGLATEVRDWLFGRNPWGVSFIVGVPGGGTAPTRPHHPLAALGLASLTGAVVDGPVGADIHRGLKYSELGPDRFAPFQSDFAVYHDDQNDFATNEPILDGTVSLLLLLSLWA